MAPSDCSEILEKAYHDAKQQLGKSFVKNSDARDQIAYVALCPSNRAGARFLLAALLAKISNPKIDIRKPFIQAYSESENGDAYPGRNYDEQYVFDFITRHKLPCSPTTAFLTPAFRTKNVVLDLNQTLRGCYFLLVASENWIAATDHDDFFLKVPGLLPTREWFAGRCFTVRSCGPILQAVHFNSF